MARKNDPYYGAMLVEEARLHLGTVMAGQDSEPFFFTMLQLIEANIHNGYTTLRNKPAKLKGIKDFLHNCNYGLGIKDLTDFLEKVTESALKENSKNRYGHQFIRWLAEQDEVFAFPSKYYKLRNLTYQIWQNKRLPREKRLDAIGRAKIIYRNRPDLLFEIGPGKKYSSVNDCYYGEEFEEQKKNIKSFATYSNPTSGDVDKLVKTLYGRFGLGRMKLLCSKIYQLCKDEDPAWAGCSGDDDDASAARPWWEDRVDHPED